MNQRTNPGMGTQQVNAQRLRRRAETLRNRLLRRWLARGLRRLASAFAAFRAEAELRAMDARELRDLGLDRGGIASAVRHGRTEHRLKLCHHSKPISDAAPTPG